LAEYIDRIYWQNIFIIIAHYSKTTVTSHLKIKKASYEQR